MDQIGRRQFLIATGALLAAPRVSRAQRARRTYVVGALLSGSGADIILYRSTLRKRLASHGFVERRNLRIEDRNPGGTVGGGQHFARELVAMNVDAIFACFAQVVLGAQAETKSIPIVFSWVGDPILFGVLGNLAQPDGNVTGVTSRVVELMQKRIELALELVPDAKRMTYLGASPWPIYTKGIRPSLMEAASRYGIEIQELPWDYSGPRVLDSAKKAGAQIVLSPIHIIGLGLRRILDALIKRSIELRLPVIFIGADEVEAGGLVSYGTNPIDDIRRGADLLAKVLKGARPEHLPVDQASRFELAVNLKTAKALGITIPPSIMLRADHVIE